MTPLKCVFGVSAGRFLGFIVHEHGIQINAKKIESIKKLGEPKCKKDVHKLLGKINYVRRFIYNLVGRVESFLPLVRLKHEGEFVWGVEQKRAFDNIKEYLNSPPVLRALKAGEACKLYIATQERAIGAALTQEDKGKEFVVAYLSRRLVDVETRYEFIEKLCLSLYFACNKLRCCLLYSMCTIICQHDVVKFMLQKPVLRGRVEKWIYSLVEYDMRYKSLWLVKGQVVADFVVDHMVSMDGGVSLVELCAWSLYFDSSVYSRGQ
jgi:hypothetical protein